MSWTSLRSTMPRISTSLYFLGSMSEDKNATLNALLLEWGHVTAGALNCENCHGDVGNMVEVYPVADMNMGWCLRCHNQQPNADQLKDCAVCHR